MIKKMVKAIGQEIRSWTVELLHCVPGRIGSKLRALCFQPFWGACGREVYIAPYCFIRGFKNIRLGDKVKIGIYNQLCASGQGGEAITIGSGTAFNSNVMINADFGGQIHIGANVLIGPNVVIRASNHRFRSPDVLIKEQGHQAGVIRIDDNVWLGANVVILPDVHVHSGAVVAAGAVVSKDVAADTIVGGVPAQVIGPRIKSPSSF